MIFYNLNPSLGLNITKLCAFNEVRSTVENIQLEVQPQKGVVAVEAASVPQFHWGLWLRVQPYRAVKSYCVALGKKKLCEHTKKLLQHAKKLQKRQQNP